MKKYFLKIWGDSMKYQLKNECLKIEIDDNGAELQSVMKDGQEYLWVADKTYWDEHSPLLFPLVGRMTGGEFLLNGKRFSQEIHGFARHCTYEVLEETGNSITFFLKDNTLIREMYPYQFELRVVYTLIDNQVQITYQVENFSQDTMYFGIGGHPGFNLPLEEGLKFEDYYLEFGAECKPDQVGLTDACFLNGCNRSYLLDENRIPLRHDLFDHDAIVLQNMADQITLKSDKGKRSVTLYYPDMPYLGIWHNPYTEAPFVAIEPWASLPARQDIVEELRFRSDFIHLRPKQVYTNQWSIAVE